MGIERVLPTAPSSGRGCSEARKNQERPGKRWLNLSHGHHQGKLRDLGVAGKKRSVRAPGFPSLPSGTPPLASCIDRGRKKGLAPATAGGKFPAGGRRNETRRLRKIHLNDISASAGKWTRGKYSRNDSIQGVQEKEPGLSSPQANILDFSGGHHPSSAGGVFHRQGMVPRREAQPADQYPVRQGSP